MRAELSLAGESFVNEFALEGAPGSFFTRDSWQLTSPLIGLVAIELPSETDMLPDGIAVDLGGEKLAIEHSVFAIGEPLAVALANPSSHLGEYGGAQFLCNYYRTVTPFRGSVEADAASTATATLEEDSGWLYKLGPYRFTDSQSGASFEASVHYAELQWVDGKPVAHGGSFTSED